MTTAEDPGDALEELPAPRVPMLVQGACSAALGCLVVLLATTSTPLLLVLLLVVQLVLARGFLGLVDAPADGGAFLVVGATTLALDAVAYAAGGAVGGLVGVVGLSVSGALVHQLSRRSRSRVIESLADTLVAVVLAGGVACLLALRQLPGGRAALVSCLWAAVVALVLGRAGDRVAAAPALAVGATRGWPGLVLALGAGSLAAVAAGSGPVDGSRAALLGLAAAAAASAGDLVVGIGAAELRAGWRDARRVAALRPVGLLLPFAALGPVAYVAGRLVLR